jgi:MFS family permease
LAAAFAWSPQTLLAARCVTMMGVSLELVAALTWLAELFPDPERRERVLGYSQIASGVGNFVATGAYYVAVTWAARLPQLGGHHDAWRYALTAGVIPSVPLLLARSWLPESPLWISLRAQDARHRPLIATLFRPPLRRGTIVATLVTACVYAGADGVLQQAPRLVPVLPDARDLAPRLQEQIVSAVHFFGSLGEVVGRVVFASMVVAVARQRQLLRAFMIPALIVLPIVFVYAATSGIVALGIASFVATLLVMAQFSFIGNYLPRLFPTDVRGTGESVAINVGGRVIGAAAAFATPQLVGLIHGLDPAPQLAVAMAVTAVVALGIGSLLTLWMPEPTSDHLP